MRGWQVDNGERNHRHYNKKSKNLQISSDSYIIQFANILFSSANSQALTSS
jgi:hypothetical protein